MLFPTKRRSSRSGSRLKCEALEERTVPAWNLSIDGDLATSGVSSTVASGTTTFVATASGATLDVADIQTALAAGDVLISSGSTGGESGSISWVHNSAADDLTYSGPNLRQLTIEPDSSALVESITLSGVTLNFDNNVDLVIDSSIPVTDGQISLVGDTRIDNANTVEINAGVNDVQLASSSTKSMASSNIHITAGNLQNLTSGYTLRSDEGDVTIDANILLTDSMAMRAELGTLTINGGIDSFTAKDFATYGTGVALNEAIGAVHPLGTMTFAGGTTSFTSTVSATTVDIGDTIDDPAQAVVSGSGLITADVNVESDGVIAPGGTGAVGAMTITGDLAFDDGVFALDLGTNPDTIDVTGNLTINGGYLGDSSSTGALTVTNPFTIIAVSGTTIGAFTNAALNHPLIVGFDAITVTEYAPSGVVITQVPSQAGGIFTGNDLDGTTYKLRLTGPGELIAFTSPSGAIELVAHGTTIASKITLTTKANASDDLVDVGPVLIAGDLGSFSAAHAMLVDQLTVRTLPGTSGTLKSLSFYDVFAPIVTPGALTALTVGNEADLGITALSIGKIKVTGTMSSSGDWNVVNGITSISAGNIYGVTITAKYLGSISALGQKAMHLAGNMGGVTLHLTGNDATTKTYGLKTLTAKGNVEGSTFDVQNGSVGTFTVGRFLDSGLFLNYSPAGAFNVGGTFNSGSHFTLAKFTTTAATIGDPNNPNNYAFAGSQIAADTIGTVRLTGLDTSNSGAAFGLKFRTAGGSVRTKTADSLSIPLNTNLSPSAGPIANDFYFLDV